MKNGRIIVGILCLIMLGFLFWSVSIAPATMEHGYYVTTGKFFAQGMVPWKDFNLMDMPLGTVLISIPYLISGISANGWPALALVIFIHMVNAILLGILLRNNHVKRVYLWSSILLYLIMIYSACGLNVCLEPFAVFFILMALLGLYSPNRTKNVLGAFMVICAVGCKIQVLVLLPALYLYTILPITAKHWHWKRGNVFLVAFFIIAAFCFIIITVYSGNSTWYTHLRLSISPKQPEVSMILFNWALLAARTSLFLLLPGLLLAKKMSKGACKWESTAIFAVGGIAAIQVFGYDKSWAQLILPFVALCYGITLQELGRKSKWISILLVIGFLFPSYLVYREFQKLEMGEAKEKQEENLDFLSCLTEKDTRTAVLPYACAEYEIGAQIFSERNVAVHDPLHTTYGFIDWEKPEQDINDALAADAIIFPTFISLYGEKFTGSEPAPKWAVDLVKHIYELHFRANFDWAIIMKKDFSDTALKRLEKVVAEQEEHHEHNHEHEHHHEH